MLITSVSLYSEDFVTSCTITGCTPVSTTMTLSQYVRVGNCTAQVFYEYWKCGTPPNEFYTYKITGLNLDCNGGTPPNEATVMKKVKEYLLLIANAASNSGNPFVPNNFKVEIKAPSCFKFESNGSYYEGTSTYTSQLSCSENCCSNTYTLDGTGGEISVTNVDRSNSSSSTCIEFGKNPDCVNACSETEIPEGVLPLQDYYDCIDNPDTGILFGDNFTYSGTNSEYFSYLDLKSGIGSYEVSPKMINTIDGTGGVVDGPSMAKYIMDLIYHRTSVLGVNANDMMILRINNCWSNCDGNAFPCNDECCQFNFNFIGGKIIIAYSNTGSSTCSSPCFDVCSDIQNLNNLDIVNAKSIFDNEEPSLSQTQLSISPNPSNGLTSLNIKTNNLGNYEISLSTTDGFTFIKRNINVSSQEFNYELQTKNIANGVYFVTLTYEGKKIITKKIIIQN